MKIYHNYTHTVIHSGESGAFHVCIFFYVINFDFGPNLFTFLIFASIFRITKNNFDVNHVTPFRSPISCCPLKCFYLNYIYLHFLIFSRDTTCNYFNLFYLFVLFLYNHIPCGEYGKIFLSLYYFTQHFLNLFCFLFVWGVEG